MSIILVLLFWLSAFFIFYTYIIYPFLLRQIAKRNKSNSIKFADNDELPNVIILMSAFNEDQVIKAKVESMLGSDYPPGKLFFYIGSDASSDKTDEILRSFHSKNEHFTFIRYDDRGGKANVINKLYQQVVQDAQLTNDAVLILTDANVIFSSETVIELVRHFKNPDIGQVGAQIINKGMKRSGISYQEQFYINRENRIKNDEGIAWGTMMGAFGACYAIRAKLFKRIPANYLMEDFFLSMHVLSQGKKAIHEMKAICYEDVSDDARMEYKRKRRISAGNYQNLSSYKQLLWPPTKALGFSFLSHKVLRWFGPFFILISFISSFLLSFHSELYLIAFLGMFTILMTPLIERLLKKLGIHSIALKFISYFIYMNLALLEGFFVYLKGVKTNVWQPTKRINE